MRTSNFHGKTMVKGFPRKAVDSCCRSNNGETEKAELNL